MDTDKLVFFAVFLAVLGVLSFIANPKITARALQILDPTLPPQLMKAWRKERDIDFDDEDYRAELHTQTDEGL